MLSLAQRCHPPALCFVGCQGLAKLCMDMAIAQLQHEVQEPSSQLGFKVRVHVSMATLSFISCATSWEKHRVLRKRARARMMLVQDTKNRSHVSPTLANLKFNAPVLKPFTEAMANYGKISKPVHLIKEALRKFYSRENEEMEETPETVEMRLRKDRNISKSAKAIAAMLTVVKRKWTKWELPRVTWIYEINVAFPSFDISKTSN